MYTLSDAAWFAQLFCAPKKSRGCYGCPIGVA